jgi:hypothetical protein
VAGERRPDANVGIALQDLKEPAGKFVDAPRNRQRSQKLPKLFTTRGVVLQGYTH